MNSIALRARPAKQLKGLAKQINDSHRQCEQSLKRGLRHALEAGRLLLAAKGMVGHGRWSQWLERNCNFSARLAQRYMQVARHMPKLDPANTPRVTDLSFRQALFLAARNASCLASLPSDEQVEVLDIAEEQQIPCIGGAVRVKRRADSAEAIQNPCRHMSATIAPHDRPVTVRKATVEGYSSEHVWEIRIGPNDIGRNLPKLAAEKLAEPKYQVRAMAIDALKKDAARLLAESKRAEKQAREQDSAMNHEIGLEIRQQYGEAYPYLTTISVDVLDQGLRDSVVACGSDQERQCLLAEGMRTGKAHLVCQGFWGDIMLWCFSSSFGNGAAPVG